MTTKEKAAWAGPLAASKTYPYSQYTTPGGIDNLLSKLDKVKRTGNGTWRASCPCSIHAHGDRSAGLCLSEKDDGRILVWCPVGCEASEIVGAVGLTLSDLFPPREIQHGKPERRPFPAADVLRAVGFEALVVASAGVSMLAGNFTGGDRERLIIAVSRIQAAMKAAGVTHG